MTPPELKSVAVGLKEGEVAGLKKIADALVLAHNSLVRIRRFLVIASGYNTPKYRTFMPRLTEQEHHQKRHPRSRPLTVLDSKRNVTA